MEGWASGMWGRFTGVLLWKTQNPWAGLRGQLYDCLLAQTGGFYGVRCACEPLHVQLNLHSLQVRNMTHNHLMICSSDVADNFEGADLHCAPFYGGCTAAAGRRV